ncbi:MAG TPA: VOC family protein [Alphaproteobacteria bacterium]|nr:VOC family protein [Alphaproteobacteria bacterium]
MTITKVGLLVCAAVALCSMTGAFASAQSAQESVTGISALINVSNLDKSLDFFTRLVGLKEARRVPLGPGAWEVILSPDGKDTGSSVVLVYRPDHTEPVQLGTGFNRVAFFLHSADEVDAKASRIMAEGYKAVIPPTSSSMPGGRKYRYTHLKGPDGYTVEFTYFDPNIIVPKEASK